MIRMYKDYKENRLGEIGGAVEAVAAKWEQGLDRFDAVVDEANQQDPAMHAAY